MTRRRAMEVQMGVLLVGAWLLVVGPAQAQEIRDVKTLSDQIQRAEALIAEGKKREAVQVYERVVQAAPKLLGAASNDTATLYHHLAELYKPLHEYAKAEPLYQRSLKITEDQLGKDHLEVAIVLNNLAQLYYFMGLYGKVEPLYLRSLKIREDKLGKDHPRVASSLNDLAVLYNDMGQYARAEPRLLRCLKIYEDKLGKDHPDVAPVLNNLAQLYKEMGLYDKVEPLFLRSLQIKEDKLGKNHPGVALSVDNLAGLYYSMGQYEKAESFYQRSLKIYEAKLGKDHPDVATTVNNMAELYRATGQYAKAEPLYRRSLKIREDQLGKDHLDVANILNNLAVLAYHSGQYEKAEPLYQRCLKIRTDKLDKDHPSVAGCLSNLADVYEATDQSAQAANTMDRSRRISRRHVTRVLPALAEPDQADFLRSKDKANWESALSLGLRHPDDEKLATLSAAWLLNGKGVAQQTLASTTLFARDSRDPKLRELSHSLHQTRQELGRLTLAPVKGDQTEQRQRRLNELNQREQELAKEVRQAGGAAEETWIELDRVRQELPADTVLINLARFEVFDFKTKAGKKRWQPAHYAAWIIPAKGPVRLLDLGPAAAIDVDVKTVRQALQDANKTMRLKGEADAETAQRAPLEALAKKVLHPLLPLIGKSPRWIISPDGNLWLVPWAALPLTDGKYAVENHILSYVISGRELVAPPLAKATPTAPLVLADPDFDLGLDQVALATRRLHGQEAPAETRGLSKALRLVNIKRLPATATEAAAITAPLRRYAGAAPRVLTDQDATAGVFLAARNPKVVVLSTHGYFLPHEELDPKKKERPNDAAPSGLRFENPLLRCGLLLAGCNNAAKAQEGADNGVLTGLQIVGTDLRGCELVVLSACETGLGDVRNGEGVAGLRQAFQLAGAESVVATLWQVPDQQSAQLMIGFFDQLAAKQGKAEALRNAQLALIKARRDRTAAAHPFFWAAFTVTGR